MLCYIALVRRVDMRVDTQRLNGLITVFLCLCIKKKTPKEDGNTALKTPSSNAHIVATNQLAQCNTTHVIVSDLRHSDKLFFTFTTFNEFVN